MDIPSTSTPNRDTLRFLASFIVALTAHSLLFATWDALPFAHPPTDRLPSLPKNTPTLAVQFVKPQPPPPPAPIPAPAPPKIEKIITAIPRTEPLTPIVEKTEPAPKVPPAPKPAPTAPRREAADNLPERSERNPQSVRASSEQDKPKPAKTTIRTSSSRATPPPSSHGPPSPPSYRYNPKPPYPTAAKKAGAEGTTFLRVDVLPSGKVGSVAVVRSSGNRDLDNAAARTVKSSWRFYPAKRAGTAVSARVTIPIRFELR